MRTERDQLLSMAHVTAFTDGFSYHMHAWPPVSSVTVKFACASRP
jgi:hypothetical protein